MANILVIENCLQRGTSIWQAIKVKQTQIERANTFKEALFTIINKPIDCIICEFQLEDGNVIKFIENVNQLTPRPIPIIVLANKMDEKLAMELVRQGARAFILRGNKQDDMEKLSLIIQQVLKEEMQYRENIYLNMENEKRSEAIFDGIIGLSPQMIINFANPSAALYLDENLGSLLGKSIEKYAAVIDDLFFQTLKHKLKKAQSGVETILGEYVFALKSKKKSTIQISLTPIFNDELVMNGYVLCFKDVSKTKFLSDKIQQISIQDDLTGLFNRKTFIYRIEHAIAYCQHDMKCAVLFIDLDDFKKLNDVLGHKGGDEILLHVVKRIKAVLHETDILARTGGDEFSILLMHVNHPNEVAKIAYKINRTLRAVFELKGEEHYLTASIGIAIYPNDGKDAETLVQYADFAMTLVKKQGKNNYQYYKADLNAQAKKMIQLSNELRHAVEANQLDLCFHPLVDTQNRMLVGLEALLRWNHPTLGMIPPSLFIPLAEEMGLIDRIGYWVLNKTCQCYDIWKKEGLDNFSLSVNVSIKELQRRTFVEDVVQCIERYHVDPHRLQFEITESIFIYGSTFVIDKLHQLKQMGFQIAMDDFGTGYSCLSYLKDLPIDVIKIDRSFIQFDNLQENNKHKAILAVIIDLAKCLNVHSLAEGVETEEQAELLSSLGCDYLQGFLFAKPMPFEQVTKFITQNMMVLKDPLQRKAT